MSAVSHPVTFTALEDIRAWIGRRLILRKALGEFEAGTVCIVMCAVDFGDGLLLWVKTEDEALLDVGQFELTALREHFVPASVPAVDGAVEHALSKPGQATSASSFQTKTATASRGDSAGVAVTIVRRVAGFGAELVRSFASAREAACVAERYLRMSEDQLAARGLDRHEVSKRVREILCR